MKQYSYKKKIYAEQKKPDPKELHHIVYEALKQAKIISSDRNRKAVGCRATVEENKEFCGVMKMGVKWVHTFVRIETLQLRFICCTTYKLYINKS